MTEGHNGIEALHRAARQRYIDAHPESRARLEQAAQVMPGGNTRSSLWSDPFPLCVQSGQGCRITDVDGHEVVDLMGEYTAGIFGHSEPILAEAVAEAHRTGINLSSHSTREIELARRLTERFPSMELMRFANSGTEANLMAVALAKAATGRGTVVVFANGYHGSLMYFGSADNPMNAPHDWLILPYNDIAAAEAAFAGRGAGIAAVVVEPMQGSTGCIPGDPAFLQALRRLTGDAGAVLIFDEVQTSRMGPGGMQALLGIRPDMTVLGKYLGGGMAFGAFGGRRDLMERFDPSRPGALAHAGTYNNNSLTMAAGIAALDHILTAEALEALYRRGEALRERIETLLAGYRAPYRISGIGSLMNLHGVADDAGTATALLRLLQLELLEAGYYLAPRGLIALSLAVGETEIEGVLAALEAFLARHRDALAG